LKEIGWKPKHEDTVEMSGARQRHAPSGPNSTIGYLNNLIPAKKAFPTRQGRKGKKALGNPRKTELLPRDERRTGEENPSGGVPGRPPNKDPATWLKETEKREEKKE